MALMKPRREVIQRPLLPPMLGLQDGLNKLSDIGSHISGIGSGIGSQLSSLWSTTNPRVRGRRQRTGRVSEVRVPGSKLKEVPPYTPFTGNFLLCMQCTGPEACSCKH